MTPTLLYSIRRRTLNRKEQLRHRAVSSRQHGFLVILVLIAKECEATEVWSWGACNNVARHVMYYFIITGAIGRRDTTPKIRFLLSFFGVANVIAFYYLNRMKITSSSNCFKQLSLAWRFASISSPAWRLFKYFKPKATVNKKLSYRLETGRQQCISL